VFRAIIHDNLTRDQIKTRKCATEEAALVECANAVKRLCKKYRVDTADNRFVLYCIEIETA
jgi:hypothetical protein